MTPFVRMSGKHKLHLKVSDAVHFKNLRSGLISSTNTRPRCFTIANWTFVAEICLKYVIINGTIVWLSKSSKGILVSHVHALPRTSNNRIKHASLRFCDEYNLLSIESCTRSVEGFKRQSTYLPGSIRVKVFLITSKTFEDLKRNWKLRLILYTDLNEYLEIHSMFVYLHEKHGICTRNTAFSRTTEAV